MITLDEARNVIAELKRDSSRKSFSSQEFINIYSQGCVLSYKEMLRSAGNVTNAHKLIGQYLRNHCNPKYNLDIRFQRKEMGCNAFDRYNQNARWIIVSRNSVN